MRILVVHNLASGIGEGTIYDFIRLVIADGDEVVVRATDGTTDFRTFFHDAKDFDRIVIAGGDGTISTAAYQLAYTDIPILAFPSGTANLLNQNLLLPFEVPALAKLLKEGRSLKFDLGELNIEGDRYGFGLMSGCGYDAIIMENANPNKHVLGPIAYFGAAVMNANVPVSEIKLILDGKEVITEGFGVLLINFSKIQFDISITHANMPYDGILDIAVLKGKNAMELIPALISGILDRDQSFPDRGDSIEFYQAHVVTVEANPAMSIQYDGEIIHKTTPFSARILPGAATFIVSDEGYDVYHPAKEK